MAVKRHERGHSRCGVGVDPSAAALPVAGTGTLSHVRPSRTSKWRAGVLIGVHLLVAAHVTHFMLAGSTLSPVEPSEAMYTFELGQVNAGFLFLVLTLLATLVFGRFFCGWGCHIVALQDLCGWMMKRLGVRPRPFRSRLLVWVPLALALYMFVWPTLRRWLFDAGAAFPGFSDHLITTSFWKTFPGPLFAALTFAVCGFAAVYFLGAKGFCTYGCPYGGLFGVVDLVSPGRIVVNDDCEQCGHCSVTCTSNVLVHEEVRRFGRVVDPGCMKCMDCVSVCPKGALSFRFAMPSLVKRPADDRRVRRYSLSLVEELGLVAICLGSAWAYRGLYDGPPLLMSVGLGGITAFVALLLWRLARRGDVRLQSVTLKRGGRFAVAGRVFTAVAVLWLVFTAHSAFVQWHRERGRAWLARTEASREDVLSGRFRDRTYSAAHGVAARRTFAHFALADRWGLLDVVEVQLGLAWGRLIRGEDAAAERALRRAIELAPSQPQLHDHLVAFLSARGRQADTITALRDRIAATSAGPTEHFALATALAEAGRVVEAAEEYERAVALAPGVFGARYNLGGVLRRLGRNAEAVEHLRVARQLAPEDADTRVELGLALAELGANAEAILELRQAIELAPERPEARLYLPQKIRELERAGGR